VDQQLKSMGKEFLQLTGEDYNALEFNKRGGKGCISVTANVASKLCSEFQSATLSENENARIKAEKINNLLTPLHKALFIESNPSPVKYAASLLKLAPEDVRLPLVRVKDSTKEKVKEALKAATLL